MEAPTAPRPAGLPSPRSPTLSEISMILPDGDKPRSVSPSLHRERPPSPSSFYAHTNRSQHTIRLGSAPQSGRREPSPQSKSPPLSAHSSRSTLRTMDDSEAAAQASVPGAQADTLASSPTVGDSLRSPHASDWRTPPERKSSSGSSSMDSEDFENMKRWPGFDSNGAFDDSGVDLDEEERDQFPVDVAGENEHSDNDDHYSSDLYSRRAEIILANAKKRLNVMEGNLRGARQSLVVSPTFNGVTMASEMSRQISVARERDRRLYAGMGPIPPRNRAYPSPHLATNSSPGHNRGLSDTTVPLPFSSPTYLYRNQPNKRASSAMGVASAPWSPEGHGTGRFPIRESRSFEVMRDPRHGPGHEDKESSLRSHSRGSRSPPNHLETLPEDESPRLHRSASTTSILRDQMDSLKGRISSLKLKAQEDHLRRCSLQSLRTPSPFTSAETWYSGTDAYKNGGSPIAADAGVGLATESPTRKALYEDEESGFAPRITTTPPPAETDGAVKPVGHNHDIPDDDYTDEFHYDSSPTIPAASKTGLGIQAFPDVHDSDTDFVSVDGDDVEAGGDSVYEDAVYEMPATERHEDRVDAFDYENFFLHSAMGTYSLDRRNSSSSGGSADSVATTRPVTAILDGEALDKSVKRVSYHQRTTSSDSVSTVATYATATEGYEDDLENEQMDQFSQQIMPNLHPAQQRYTTSSGPVSPAIDSGISTRRVNGSPTQASQTSRGSTPPGDMSLGLQTSKIYSIMLETPREEPRLALNEEEKQLIYSLAASFQHVCAKLQSTSGDQYERKEWRRRLDEARRLLNGEEFEGDPF